MDEFDQPEQPKQPEQQPEPVGPAFVAPDEGFSYGAPPLAPGPPPMSLPMSVDVIAHEPARKSRRGLVAAVTAGTLVLVGAGGYAAFAAFNGSGSQPEAQLPASTVAMVKIDLDPSAGQKIEALQLLRKFPAAQVDSTDTDFGEWLLRRLAETDDTSKVDFAKDVQPWLGKRFVVAGVPDAGSTDSVGTVLVIQETDEKAAAAGLDKIKAAVPGSSKLNYVFKDGYVVVAPDTAGLAQRAVDAAASAPLSADATYTSDVASLQSDQIVTGWVDAAKVGSLVQKAADKAGVPGGLNSLGGTGDLGKGRYVLGMHVTSGSVVVQVQSHGAKPLTTSPPLGDLSGTVSGAYAVVAVGGVGDALAAQWTKLAATPGFDETMGEVESRFGLSLPGDLTTLLGDKLVVSAGGSLQAPAVVAAMTSKDPAAAKALLDRILDRAGVPSGVVAERVGGGTFYVGTTQEAVDGAGAGGITADPYFAAAVASPSTAQALVFVDLTKVWDALPAGSLPDEQADQIKNVAAVGLSSQSTSDGSSFELRVVVR